jgi:hypothetical protein
MLESLPSYDSGKDAALVLFEGRSSKDWLALRMETFGAVKSALTSAGFIPDSSRRAKVGILDKRCARDSVVVRKEESM